MLPLSKDCWPPFGFFSDIMNKKTAFTDLTRMQWKASRPKPI